MYVKDSFLAVPVESRPIQPIAVDNSRPVVVESAGQLVQKVPAIPEQKSEKFILDLKKKKTKMKALIF